MRVIIQRVLECQVKVNNQLVGSIGKGLLVLAGFEHQDTKEDLEWMAAKITRLRIFADKEGKMNCSILDAAGDILVVSQFTLHAQTKKGNRPSYIKSAPPDISIPLYEDFVTVLEKELGKKIQTGQFGADMKVGLVNDGPVTIYMDSKKKE